MAYDLVTIGGGLAGASLAKAMAEAGARVLVLERESEFRDRVRGEGMHPWGVAEAKELGIYERLVAIGNQTRFFTISVYPVAMPPRDLVQTSPYGVGSLNFYHPEMQEQVLEAAAEAGAEVRRGTVVTGVEPGSRPAVQLRGERLEARLVVGADGRRSRARDWAGFETHRDPERMVLSGVLMRGISVAEDGVNAIIRPGRGAVILFPLGRDRCRAYYGYRKRDGQRLHLTGSGRVRDFLKASLAVGAPDAWYEGAQAVGPLAEFEGADTWVEHPYRDGIVLIGDAAAATDPVWGCGQSLTLRDVRVLRDRLLESDDWSKTADAYAREHDQYYGALHRAEAWMTEMFFDYGPEADARREQALPLVAADQTRMPDVVGVGPETPSDESARRRFFAEE